MKFLIFNIAVTAALVYLLIGEGQMPGLDDVMSRTEKATTQVTSTLAAMVTPERELPAKNERQSPPKPVERLEPVLKSEEPSSDDATPAAASVKPRPVSPNAQTRVPRAKPEASAPAVTAAKPELAPLPAAQTVAMRQAKPVPVPISPSDLRSVESAPAKNPRVLAEPPAPKFMTPAERRRELSKLARSAETLFLDRLSN